MHNVAKSEEDYASLPDGSIVACVDALPWTKVKGEWRPANTGGRHKNNTMADRPRCVLREGWGV